MKKLSLQEALEGLEDIRRDRSVWYHNLLRAETSLRGSFSDKQFMCLLDTAFLDKILASACCS